MKVVPASGSSVTLATLDDGDAFGEEALLSDAKRNASITMTSDGELVRLTKDDFIELIKKPSLESVDYEAAQAMVVDGACWLDLRFHTGFSEWLSHVYYDEDLTALLARPVELVGL